MTVNEARKIYTNICGIIFDTLMANGWNEDDEAVVNLRSAARNLGLRYGFEFEDEEDYFEDEEDC